MSIVVRALLEVASAFYTVNFSGSGMFEVEGKCYFPKCHSQW